jgi:hypothetical protein
MVDVMITRNTKKAIEDALSEALTDPNAPTYREYNQKSSLGRRMEDLQDYLIQQYDMDYNNRQQQNDVRFNRQRGRTY